MKDSNFQIYIRFERTLKLRKEILKNEKTFSVLKIWAATQNHKMHKNVKLFQSRIINTLFCYDLCFALRMCRINTYRQSLRLIIRQQYAARLHIAFNIQHPATIAIVVADHGPFLAEQWNWWMSVKTFEKVKKTKRWFTLFIFTAFFRLLCWSLQTVKMYACFFLCTKMAS